ncbi:uncharacterized protein LOC118222813 [Tachysurus ichikawai]
MSDPSSEEDPCPTENPHGPSARRSPRPACISPPPIVEWPVKRILAALFSQNIQEPLGFDHSQLFQFFLENIPEIPPTQSTPTPGPKKATAKRKHCLRANNPSAPKRRTVRPHITPPISEDPVLTACIWSTGQSSTST